MGEVSTLSLVPDEVSPAVTKHWLDADNFVGWRSGVRQAVLASVAAFVDEHCVAELDRSGIDSAGDTLVEFISGGKCLRSTFMYLGWLCGAAPSDAALAAAASLELLHAFALLQDDVMDGSPERRGRQAVHIKFADWHRDRKLAGSPRRFGESAAVLLGDLCLIWAEQMLRESGVDFRSLQRVWPRYGAMRTELAVGQFADLSSDVRDLPPLDAVLDVARRKSGNYTVRRPLEIGAAMAGCDECTLSLLGRYGAAVGEAFQLRDDMLGVFGSPEVTGKPSGGDLLERKATSVLVTAHHMADAGTRRELAQLMHSENLDEGALDRWKTLIVQTGAAQWIEELIGRRVTLARNVLDHEVIDSSVCIALDKMATACTERAE